MGVESLMNRYRQKQERAASGVPQGGVMGEESREGRLLWSAVGAVVLAGALLIAYFLYQRAQEEQREAFAARALEFRTQVLTPLQKDPQQWSQWKARWEEFFRPEAPPQVGLVYIDLVAALPAEAQAERVALLEEAYQRLKDNLFYAAWLGGELVRAREDQGRPAEALELLRELVQRPGIPTLRKLQLDLGRLLWQRGERDEAQKFLELVVQKEGPRDQLSKLATLFLARLPNGPAANSAQPPAGEAP